MQEDDGVAMGMRPALAQRAVRGIMNGLDTAAWAPATDTHLLPPMRFTANSVASGKAAAKAWLQVCWTCAVSGKDACDVCSAGWL